jgi:hypothetical protein
MGRKSDQSSRAAAAAQSCSIAFGTVFTARLKARPFKEDVNRASFFKILTLTSSLPPSPEPPA